MSCAFSLCPLSPLLSKCLNIVHFLPVLPPFFCSPLCLISSFPWWNFAERHVCSCVTKGRNVALFFPASSLVWCICHSNKMQMESSERVCRLVAQWLWCVEKACSVCVLHCEPHALPWKNPRRDIFVKLFLPWSHSCLSWKEQFIWTGAFLVMCD